MTRNPGEEIIECLRTTLGPRWDFQRQENTLTIRLRRHTNDYTPPRRLIDWPALLDRLTTGFASCGVLRAAALPIRCQRDTDFTISAIQALDPYLKDAKHITFRQGFLPQPAIRFTARRDRNGDLHDGYLTSFVNVSQVQPTDSIADHAMILDGWLSVLSGLGLHTRHLAIGGSLNVWRRAELEGITLRIWHAGLEVGDIVLLWNADNPSFMATDLGSGLERLRWTITRQDWQSLIFGPLAHAHHSAALDAIRTATLIVGSGIAPAPRGRGSAVRRLLRYVPQDSASLGLSTAVRIFYEYWELTTRLLTPWEETTRILENELAIRDRLHLKLHALLETHGY